MPLTFDAVHELAMQFPGVTVGKKWDARTWIVGGRGFAWVRPLRKSDLERWSDAAPPPAGDILGLRTESLDAKDALLAMGLPGFFTIAHFNGYAAVLVALKQARAKDVRAAIEHAYQAMAAKPPAKPRKGKPKAAGRGKGTSPARSPRSSTASKRPRRSS